MLLCSVSAAEIAEVEQPEKQSEVECWTPEEDKVPLSTEGYTN